MSWLDRQSFLGVDNEDRLKAAVVGLVGLGGGNSHVAQQLAHVGIGNFVVVDHDAISETNLNRLIGGTREYVKREADKVEIMERMIKAINPDANVDVHRSQWQLAGDALKHCDIILGALDNVRGKDELDAFCRRFLIPYIDQGMDVHYLGEGAGYLIAGQVVLSSPGCPCLRCLGVVTEDALNEEAKRYGDAGGKPQVVWSNGVLASTAVGLAVQLLTPWTKPVVSAFIEYDGNTHSLRQSNRLRRWGDRTCSHYPAAAVGDLSFDIRRPPPSPAAKRLTWWQRIWLRIRKAAAA